MASSAPSQSAALKLVKGLGHNQETQHKYIESLLDNIHKRAALNTHDIANFLERYSKNPHWQVFYPGFPSSNPRSLSKKVKQNNLLFILSVSGHRRILVHINRRDCKSTFYGFLTEKTKNEAIGIIEEWLAVQKVALIAEELQYKFSHIVWSHSSNLCYPS